MKRIVLMLVTAFLLGGVAMAQQTCCKSKKADPKVRAERMTERMVKEYSLNDTQKQQLLEANLAWVEKMGEFPTHRKGDMKKGKKGCKACCCAKKECAKADAKCAKTDCSKAETGQLKSTKTDRGICPKRVLTDEQLAQKKAEKEKVRAEMQTARTAYDAQLQKILTKEQYSAYSKKVQEQKDKMKAKKEEAKKK